MLEARGAKKEERKREEKEEKRSAEAKEEKKESKEEKKETKEAKSEPTACTTNFLNNCGLNALAHKIVENLDKLSLSQLTLLHSNFLSYYRLEKEKLTLDQFKILLKNIQSPIHLEVLVGSVLRALLEKIVLESGFIKEDQSYKDVKGTGLLDAGNVFRIAMRFGIWVECYKGPEYKKDINKEIRDNLLKDNDFSKIDTLSLYHISTGSDHWEYREEDKVKLTRHNSFYNEEERMKPKGFQYDGRHLDSLKELISKKITAGNRNTNEILNEFERLSRKKDVTDSDADAIARMILEEDAMDQAIAASRSSSSSSSSSGRDRGGRTTPDPSENRSFSGLGLGERRREREADREKDRAAASSSSSSASPSIAPVSLVGTKKEKEKKEGEGGRDQKEEKSAKEEKNKERKYKQSNYKRITRTPDGLAGFSYQAKILMLYAFEAYAEGKKFELLTEHPDFEKFDDLILFVWEENASSPTDSYLRVLQAKHTLISGSAYALAHFLVGKDGKKEDKDKKSSLALYFDSWVHINKKKQERKAKQEEEKKEEYPAVIHYTFYSNHKPPIEFEGCLDPTSHKFTDDFIKGGSNLNPHQLEVREKIINSIYQESSTFKDEYSQKFSENIYINISSYGSEIDGAINSYIEKLNKEIEAGAAKKESKIKPFEIGDNILAHLLKNCIILDKQGVYKFTKEFIKNKDLGFYQKKIRDIISEKISLNQIRLKIKKSLFAFPSEKGKKETKLLPELIKLCSAAFSDRAVFILPKEIGIEEKIQSKTVIACAIWLAGRYGNNVININLKSETDLQYKDIILKSIKNHPDLRPKEFKNGMPLDPRVYQFFKQYELKLEQPDEEKLTNLLQEKIATKSDLTDELFYLKFYQFMLKELMKRQGTPIREGDLEDLLAVASRALNRQNLVGYGQHYLANINAQTFTAPTLTEDIKQVENFIESKDKKILMIVGEEGCGKTFSVFQALINKDRNFKKDQTAFIDARYSAGILPEDINGFKEPSFELLAIDNADLLFEQENLEALNNLIVTLYNEKKQLILILNRLASKEKGFKIFCKDAIPLPIQDLSIRPLEKKNVTDIITARNASDLCINVGGRYITLGNILLAERTGFHQMLLRPRFLNEIISKAERRPSTKKKLKGEEKLNRKDIFCDPRMSSYQPVYDLTAIMDKPKIASLYILQMNESEKDEIESAFRGNPKIVKVSIMEVKKIIDAGEVKEDDINGIFKKITRLELSNLIILLDGGDLNWELVDLPDKTKERLLNFTEKWLFLTRSSKIREESGLVLKPVKNFNLKTPYVVPIHEWSSILTFEPVSFNESGPKNNFTWTSLLDAKKAPSHFPCVITSGAGAGKSTLIQRLTEFWQMDTKNVSFQWVIRIVLTDVNLADFKDLKSLIKKFLTKDEREEWFSWEIDALQYDIEAGNVLLFFDGLDEIKGLKRLAYEQFIKKIPSMVRWVVTTRPTDLSSIRIPQQQLTLEDFNSDDITGYIQDSFPDDAKFSEKAVNLLTSEDGQVLSEVLGVPLQCYLFCEALDPYYKIWLKRIEDAKVSIDDVWPFWAIDKLKMSVLYKQFLFAKLQIFLAKHVGITQISKIQFEPRVYAFCHLHLKFIQKIAAHELFDEIISIEKKSEKTWLDEDLKEIGIDITNVTGKKKYKFMHQTYMEYLAAVYLINKLMGKKNPDPESQRLIQRFRYQKRFQLVWQFMVELVQQQDTEPDLLLSKAVLNLTHLKSIFQEPPDLIGVSERFLLINIGLTQDEEPRARSFLPKYSNCNLDEDKKSVGFSLALPVTQAKDETESDLMKVALMQSGPLGRIVTFTSKLNEHYEVIKGLEGNLKCIKPTKKDHSLFIISGFSDSKNISGKAKFILKKMKGIYLSIKKDYFDSFGSSSEAKCLFDVNESSNPFLRAIKLRPKEVAFFKQALNFRGERREIVRASVFKMLFWYDPTSNEFLKVKLNPTEIIEKIIGAIDNRFISDKEKSINSETFKAKSALQIQAKILFGNISIDNHIVIDYLLARFDTLHDYSTKLAILKLLNRVVLNSSSSEMKEKVIRYCHDFLKQERLEDFFKSFIKIIINSEDIDSHNYLIMGILNNVKNIEICKIGDHDSILNFSVSEAYLFKEQVDLFKEQITFIKNNHALLKKVLEKISQEFYRTPGVYCEILSLLAEINFTWPDLVLRRLLLNAALLNEKLIYEQILKMIESLENKKLISASVLADFITTKYDDIYPELTTVRENVYLQDEKKGDYQLSEDHSDLNCDPNPESFTPDEDQAREDFVIFKMKIIIILKAKLSASIAKYFIKTLQLFSENIETLSVNIVDLSGELLLELYRFSEQLTIQQKILFLNMFRGYLRSLWLISKDLGYVDEDKNPLYFNGKKLDSDSFKKLINLIWNCFSQTEDMECIDTLYDICFVYGIPLVRNSAGFSMIVFDRDIITLSLTNLVLLRKAEERLLALKTESIKDNYDSFPSISNPIKSPVFLERLSPSIEPGSPKKETVGELKRSNISGKHKRDEEKSTDSTTEHDLLLTICRKHNCSPELAKAFISVIPVDMRESLASQLEDHILSAQAAQEHLAAKRRRLVSSASSSSSSSSGMSSLASALDLQRDKGSSFFGSPPVLPVTPETPRVAAIPAKVAPKAAASAHPPSRTSGAGAGSSICGYFKPILIDFDAKAERDTDAKQQALKILEEVNTIYNNGAGPKKIGITYSANRKPQTETQIRGTYARLDTGEAKDWETKINGSGQASIMHSVEQLLKTSKYAYLQGVFRILPISTCMHAGGSQRGGRVGELPDDYQQEELKAINDHIQQGGVVLGWQNQDSIQTDSVFAVGGRMTTLTEQQKINIQLSLYRLEESYPEPGTTPVSRKKEKQALLCGGMSKPSATAAPKAISHATTRGRSDQSSYAAVAVGVGEGGGSSLDLLRRYDSGDEEGTPSPKAVIDDREDRGPSAEFRADIGKRKEAKKQVHGVKRKDLKDEEENDQEVNMKKRKTASSSSAPDVRSSNKSTQEGKSNSDFSTKEKQRTEIASSSTGIIATAIVGTDSSPSSSSSRSSAIDSGNERMKKLKGKWDSAGVRRHTRAAFINGKRKIFSEYEVERDGDCGFTVLGISRSDAVISLMRLIDNPRKRALIVKELVAAFELYNDARDEEHNPTMYMDPGIRTRFIGYYNRLTVAREEGGNTEAILAEMANDRGIFTSYVQSYNSGNDQQGLWLGVESMRCIAEQRGIGLTILGERKDSQELHPLLRSVPPTVLGDPCVYVILRGGHYNLLVEEGPILREEKAKTVTRAAGSALKTSGAGAGAAGAGAGRDAAEAPKKPVIAAAASSSPVVARASFFSVGRGRFGPNLRETPRTVASAVAVPKAEAPKASAKRSA